MKIGMSDEEAKRFKNFAETTIERAMYRSHQSTIADVERFKDMPECMKSSCEEIVLESYWAFMNIEKDFVSNNGNQYCPKKFQESHTYHEAIVLLKEWVEFEAMLTLPAGTWFNAETYTFEY